MNFTSGACPTTQDSDVEPYHEFHSEHPFVEEVSSAPGIYHHIFPNMPRKKSPHAFLRKKSKVKCSRCIINFHFCFQYCSVIWVQLNFLLSLQLSLFSLIKKVSEHEHKIAIIDSNSPRAQALSLADHSRIPSF